MPDFAEHYGLRLVQAVGDYPAKEVLLLIYGLPASSRFAGRLAGEERPGWDDALWLTLDLRNAVEALRTMKVNEGRGKGGKRAEFREFDGYPGHAAAKRKKAESNLASLRKRAAEAGGSLSL